MAKKSPQESEPQAASEQQSAPAELLWAEELAFLRAWDESPKPPGWLLSPRAVVTFVMGSKEEKLSLPKAAKSDGPRTLAIAEKFVGERAIVERSIVTLAGERGLLLVGEPGTAKSMLSELFSAAVCGTSALTVQGTAGTTEDQLRYGWNYAALLAKGPSREAMVPSPILTAMRRGSIARVEEVTRCLPEVQDALVSILSDRRIAVPELADVGDGAHVEPARPGFNLIATANLRDRGVSEMSAALKRRFNFETVPPIPELAREVQLVKRQATSMLARTGAPMKIDDAVIEALVTAFRDLRAGRSHEGWAIEKPSTVMSTAEAVGVASAIGLQTAYFESDRDPLTLVPGYLLGVVLKDDPKDRARLLSYWDSAVKRRAENKQRVWQQLLELRTVLEEV